MLIYGYHSAELSTEINKNLKGDYVRGVSFGGHLRHAGTTLLEKVLKDYNPSTIVISYNTAQQLSVVDAYEALDTILSLCNDYNTLPVYLLPPYDEKNQVCANHIEAYCNRHNICVVNCNNITEFIDKPLSIIQISKDKYTPNAYLLMAKYITQEITKYRSFKLHETIDYDTPLREHIKEIHVDLPVNKTVVVSGKGHINGFIVDVDSKIVCNQFYTNNERLNTTLKRSSTFLPGGHFNGDFVTELTEQSVGKFVIKQILYKGHIKSITVDDFVIDTDKHEAIDTTKDFLTHTHALVHTNNIIRKKVYNWATSTLDRCENCVPFKTATKNIIVIFSSADRPYNTESKIKYLTELSRAWNSDIQIINDPLKVLTQEQCDQVNTFKSRRKNILNYVCKIVVVYNLLEQYDKVMWLDDTNVISPFAPNLFNVVPENKIGALVIPRDCGLNDSLHDFKFLLKHRSVAIKDVYYNTGVMVIPKIYRNIFNFESVLKDSDLFQSPYPTQCWQNYLMNTHNCDVFDISCMYNMMPCVYHYDPKYNEITDISHLYQELLKYHIVHFTGFHKHREMLYTQFLQHSEKIFDQKITIVIMNFRRSENIREYILPYYDSIFAVDQVVLVHCLKDTVFDYASDKVQHVYEFDTDKEYGVFTRYIAAKKYAKNKCVLFTDDDVILPAKTLSMVYQKWKEDENRVIGAEGRRIYLDVETNLYEYKSKPFHGDVDFLLTSCCMTSYDNVVYTCDREHVMGNYKNTTKIKWNGEDMYLCLLSSVRNNNKCFSVDSPLISLDSGNHVISKVSSHVKERCRFLNLFFTNYTPTSAFAPILIEYTVSQ